MAEEPKPDAAATFYSVRTLNKWFLLSVAAMTVTYFMSVWADHYRDWKDYQREFFELERRLAVDEGAKAFAAVGGTKVLEGWKSAGGSLQEVPGPLVQEVGRLSALVAADHARRPELAKALEEAEYHYSVTNAEMKQAKAEFEAERFHYEEHAYELGEADAMAPTTEDGREAFEHYVELKNHFIELENADKDAEARRDAAKAALDEFDALANDVARKLEDAEREVNRFQKRADSNDGKRWFNNFRNAILVNFLAPTESPRKFVVDEIFDDLNFLKIPKVDMCTTCHLATDRNKDYPPGNAADLFGSDKNPDRSTEEVADEACFRSHSKPELFCTSLSPHDQGRFGCSGCHSGGNQRLSFQRTFHTPTDEEERKIWEHDEKLHWHPVHEWEFPMLGSKFLDASCYKCHRQEVHIPGAARWNRGRDLVARLGCFGCHKMAPFDGERKVGPPLGHVMSKFASLDFMLKWVDDPQSFRPSTRMPAFFHRENRATEPGRDAAEVTALAAFLYNLNTPIPLKKYPGNGDAARGKQLMGDMGGLGCLGCHNVDDFRPEKDGKLEALRHGPDLSGIGSKVTPDWLFTWIQDPKSVWPGTNMPSVRLSEQEAADFTAYLMTRKNQAFEQIAFEKPADDAIYDEMLEEKLTERMSETSAREEIKKMSGLEKRRRSGEYLLNHYGCFGCHDIPGYEDAKPIGTELNGWGSKHADRLDFGMVEMDAKREGIFNRETWLQQKLVNTRFYDRLKDKKPFEKLKMPQFSQLAGENIDWVREQEDGDAHAAETHAALPADLNNDDREAVMTFILSLTKDNTAASIKRSLDASATAVERGRRIVRDKNCIGCHVLYGEGGEIRRFIDDYAEKNKLEGATAYFPPLLDGQGARTQAGWLFSFLSDPSQGAGRGSKAHLRPWMVARMPTFDFSQEQLNDLVAYFGNEEVWHTSVDRELWDQVATKFKGDFTGYDDKTMRTADGAKQQTYQALVARLYRKQGGQFLHDTDFPYIAPVRELSDGDRDHARSLFDETLKCVLCHAPGGKVPAGKTAADMAPDLTFSRARLAPAWVKHWFEDPKLYQPGTHMPSFWPAVETGRGTVDPKGLNDAEKEMSLIRDYLYSGRFASDYDDIAKRSLK